MGRLANRFDVAVFPLVNAVLFPGVTLPLQISEKRYQQMLKDVQARGWPLAISLAVHESGERFALSPVCGAGSVQVFRDHGDGNCDVLIHGRQRVRLLSVVQRDPYFIMEAEAIEPEPPARPAPKKEFTEFLALVKTWAFINPKLPEQVALVFDEFKSFGELSDFFAFHFLKDPAVKQLYLDCADPIRRSEMLADHLHEDLGRLSRKLARAKNCALIH